MTKRIFDVLASIVGLAFLWPIMLTTAVLIKFSDGGSIFYRGIRVGLYGRTFNILKFRTMVENAEKLGGPSTCSDDRRVTAVGAFLRRYKLDELPQLINVLTGDMSFVGPRPEVASEVAQYDANTRRLLSVRPGITDYASIRFRNEGDILKGHADPHKAYKELIQPEKIRLGLQYVDEHNLLVDLKLIFMTLRAIVQ